MSHLSNPGASEFHMASIPIMADDYNFDDEGTDVEFDGLDTNENYAEIEHQIVKETTEENFDDLEIE